MKRIIILIFSLGILNSLFAQEKAMIKVFYHAKYKNLVGGAQLDDQMCLSIGRTTSCFYSLYTLKANLLRDSIKKSGGNFNDFIKLGKTENLMDGQSYRIFKNIPQGKITMTEKVGRDYVKTVEEKGSMKWTLSSRDTIIAGHKCNYAATDYHGRKWSVWYAVDIASSDGPWKLHGLPGLILWAIDSSGDYSFAVAEIRNGGKETLMQPSDNYKECSPKRLMELQRQLIENPIGVLKSNLPPGAEINLGEIEKKLLSKRRKAELIEIF